MTACLSSVKKVPSEKDYLKKRKLLPWGANIFSFRGNPFSEGIKINLVVIDPKSASVTINPGPTDFRHVLALKTV